MPIEKYRLGTLATLQTTGLNSLANGALSLGAGYNNIQAGGGGDGYTLCEVELVVTFATAPTANTGVSVWFLGAPNGTNYEDGGTSVTPSRAPDVVFPVRSVTTAQRIVRRVVLPQGLLKDLLKNDGTGATFAATGNTLNVRPATTEGI